MKRPGFAWIAACDDALWRWSGAPRLQALWLAHRSRFLVALVLSMAAFHFELTILNWSIDEELFATNPPGPNPAWLDEGRWAMYLLQMALPIATMPFVPTAVCLLFAAAAAVLVLSPLAEDDGASFYPAAALAVGCTLLFYLYTFSTLNFGIGLAAFAAAAGVALLHGGRSWRRLAGAAALFVFAVGVYQAMLAYILVAGFFMLLHRALRAPETGGALPVLKDTAVFAGVVAAALAVYAAVAKLAMMLGEAAPSGYLAGYVRSRAPGAIWDSLLHTGKLALLAYGGSAQLYWAELRGLAVLVGLSALVLLTRIVSMRARAGTKLVALALAGAGLASPFALHLVASSAPLPLRALVAVPLAIAALVLLAIRSSPKTLRLVLALLATFCFFRFVSQNHAMSQATYSAGQQDRELAIQILARSHELASRFPPSASIPMELVGHVGRRPPFLYDERNVVGLSSLVWGESKRLNAYFQILNDWRFVPASIPQRLAVLERAPAMPAWPDPGSVDIVDGVLVVKLGDYPRGQLEYLCGHRRDGACGRLAGRQKSVGADVLR